MGFEFNVENKMEEIKNWLVQDNALKLEFSGTHVTSSTGLAMVNGVIKNKIEVPESHNVYFIFDEKFKCKYVGKKSYKETINYRINLHLVANQTLDNEHPTLSKIVEVCDYLNSGYKVMYLITCEIKPKYMVESVESYFIDFYRGKEEADWVQRK